jgi:hypothetical protein
VDFIDIHLRSFLDKYHIHDRKQFTLCHFVGTRPLEGD